MTKKGASLALGRILDGARRSILFETMGVAMAWFGNAEVVAYDRNGQELGRLGIPEGEEPLDFMAGFQNAPDSLILYIREHAREQKALLIIKPDAVRRQIDYEVYRHIPKGLKIVVAIPYSMSRPVAEDLYRQHRGKPFFPALIDFMISGPSILILLKGQDAVAKVRAILGSAEDGKRQPGTIRGDLFLPSSPVRENVAHASDSAEAAEREIAIFRRIGVFL